jgi:hypothetical protein
MKIQRRSTHLGTASSPNRAHFHTPQPIPRDPVTRALSSHKAAGFVPEGVTFSSVRGKYWRAASNSQEAKSCFAPRFSQFLEIGRNESDSPFKQRPARATKRVVPRGDKSGTTQTVHRAEINGDEPTVNA